MFRQTLARSDFWLAGVFRLVTELCKLAAPMIVRELILYVKGESVLVPQSSLGGLALTVLLFLVVLLQACALQHFVHGGQCIRVTSCCTFCHSVTSCCTFSHSARYMN